MQYVYARESFEGHEQAPSIFLAGPIPRSDEIASWRPEACRLLKAYAFDGTIFVPESRSGKSAVEYDFLIPWKKRGLDLATVILFWVPRDLEKLPGFTTNIEWGRCTIKYPWKLIAGFPASAPKMGYFGEDAREHNIPLHHDLESVCHLAIRKCREHFQP